MAETKTSSILAPFVKAMTGLAAWDVKQGHGSFLTFQFGQPNLVVQERRSGTKRTAYVRGQWQLWIYCCHWRIIQNSEQIAWSEDESPTIARATARLNGQKLEQVLVEPGIGRSTFIFDLGGALETWPYGDDGDDEQWNIMTHDHVFSLNAASAYALDAVDTPLNERDWKPLI